MVNNKKISQEQKEAIVSEHLLSTEGRKKIAASMQKALRERRDYILVGRSTFLVEDLPDGALAIYDKDPEVTAYHAADESGNILSTSRGRRVEVGTFEIAANPQIPLSILKERRYNAVDRAFNLGMSQVQAVEDSTLFGILDKITTKGSPYYKPLVNVNAPVSPSAFVEAFALVEQNDNIASTIVINPLDYADLRKWGRDILDERSQRDILRTGVFAVLHGAKIRVSRVAPKGYIYVCADPEFAGRVPVRTEITALSADEPKLRRLGFSIFEQLGIGAFNPWAVARIKIYR